MLEILAIFVFVKRIRKMASDKEQSEALFTALFIANWIIVEVSFVAVGVFQNFSMIGSTLFGLLGGILGGALSLLIAFLAPPLPRRAIYEHGPMMVDDFKEMKFEAQNQFLARQREALENSRACPICEEKTTADAHFCRSCGYNLENEPS